MKGVGDWRKNAKREIGRERERDREGARERQISKQEMEQRVKERCDAPKFTVSLGEHLQPQQIPHCCSLFFMPVESCCWGVHVREG